MAQSDSSEW